MRIIDGERPKRPSNPEFTDNLWGLTQRCWIKQPKDRPKIEGVANALSAFFAFMRQILHSCHPTEPLANYPIFRQHHPERQQAT